MQLQIKPRSDIEGIFDIYRNGEMIMDGFSHFAFGLYYAGYISASKDLGRGPNFIGCKSSEHGGKS